MQSNETRLIFAGRYLKQWKRRWIILANDAFLLTFKDELDLSTPTETIDLRVRFSCRQWQCLRHGMISRHAKLLPRSRQLMYCPAHRCSPVPHPCTPTLSRYLTRSRARATTPIASTRSTFTRRNCRFHFAPRRIPRRRVRFALCVLSCIVS